MIQNPVLEVLTMFQCILLHLSIRSLSCYERYIVYRFALCCVFVKNVISY